MMNNNNLKRSRRLIVIFMLSLLSGVFAFSTHSTATQIHSSDSDTIELSPLGGQNEHWFMDIQKKNAETASRILSQNDNNALIFKIRGNAGSVKKFRGRIGKANGYGVLFKYHTVKSSGRYVWIRISGENRKLYRASIGLIKKIRRYFLKYYPMGYYYNNEFDEDRYKPDCYYEVDDDGNYHFYLDGEEYETYLRQEDGTFLYLDYDYDMYQIANMEDIQNEIEDCMDDSFLSNYERREYGLYKKVKNTKFADLSSAMKVRVLSVAFWCDTSKRQNGNPFIRYRISTAHTWSTYVKYNQSGSDLTLIRRLKKGNAIAVCEGFSMYERTLYRQLGMRTYYASTTDHAICVVKTKNSSGKTLWMYENYDTLISNNGKIEVVGGSKKAKRYTIRCSSRIRNIIQKNRWKKTDIK